MKAHYSAAKLVERRVVVSAVNWAARKVYYSAVRTAEWKDVQMAVCSVALKGEVMADQLDPQLVDNLVHE